VIALCKALEPYRPFFIEDPIRSENPGSYRNLARHISLPIAAGEQWASKWPFREVIEEELIDYARTDLCIVGGLTEALKITHWCETHYIDIAPHNPLGPVSAAACVSLCMASSNVGVQEMPRRPGSFATDLFPVQIEWQDGYAYATERPGLGVEIDEEFAEVHRVSPTSWPPLLKRNDGAFTNW
jgi:galactonate dehydratase